MVNTFQLLLTLIGQQLTALTIQIFQTTAGHQGEGAQDGVAMFWPGLKLAGTTADQSPHLLTMTPDGRQQQVRRFLIQKTQRTARILLSVDNIKDFSSRQIIPHLTNFA